MLQPSTKYLQVVAGIVIHEGRVLISQRRSDQHLAGYWEFPGGKKEEGESDRQALQREILEELGLRVRVGEKFYVKTHVYPDRGVRLIFYLCEPFQDAQPEPLQVARVTWATLEDLKNYAFPPANDEVLAKLHQRLGAGN